MNSKLLNGVKGDMLRRLSVLTDPQKTCECSHAQDDRKVFLSYEDELLSDFKEPKL